MAIHDFTDDQLQQLQQSPTVGFNLEQFTEQSKRDTERLIRAAWGVGATHGWFRKSTRAAQVAKVQEWVEAALSDAAERRALTAIARRCY